MQVCNNSFLSCSDAGRDHVLAGQHNLRAPVNIALPCNSCCYGHLLEKLFRFPPMGWHVGSLRTLLAHLPVRTLHTFCFWNISLEIAVVAVSQT